jgi:hypothetical protein
MVQQREEKTTQAETRYRNQRLEPTLAAPALVEAGDTKTEIHGVSRLHAHEGAPDEDGGGVEEAGYCVAEQQEEVGALRIYFGFEVRAKALQTSWGVGFFASVAEEGGCFVGGACHFCWVGSWSGLLYVDSDASR